MFLAKGGMAEVYIGTHSTLQRPVAIKLLKADLQNEPELLERFEREARTIAMLRHPNIVQVYDFDSYGNQPYLIMEYVAGASLGTYLRELHKRNERLNYAQILSILMKVADALTYAHENHVIHRDVKPANILLTSRSTPLEIDTPLPDDVDPILTDFGLVRFMHSSKQTSTGVITGTPAYMSPEQARGDRVDARTDVYSLGVTVYEMLAGRVPFDADTTLSVLHQHIHEPPPPIEGLSKPLQEVIDRALEKDPDARFQTPLEFAEAFDAAISGITEAETLAFPMTFAKSITIARDNLKTSAHQRKRSNAPILIILMGIIVGFAAFLAASRSPQAPPIMDMVSTEAVEPGITAAASSEVALADDTPVGLLRFQDGSGIADQITFSSNNLPLPPEGMQYELWLITDDGETRLPVGMIEFDGNNHVTPLTYVDSAGRNLIGIYHGLEITIEPKPDNSPNPSNETAFSAMLPVEGYSHVRHLLSAFQSTPNQTPFIRGLRTDTELVQNIGQEMLRAFEAGDESTARLQAERMLNIIVGNLSEDHKDWNEDGIVDDPGDGYGLLLNGTNVGYIQGTFSHANLSMTSADATENMLIHGEHVKIAADNVALWAPQLRDLLIEILEADPGSPETPGLVRQSVVLASQILEGVDINGNENIEAIQGEGGSLTAYDHAHYMADITIFP